MTPFFRAVIMTVALTACDLSPPIQTRAFQPEDAIASRGIVYHLPRSLIRVESNAKALTILAPQTRADPAARLVLEARPRRGSADDFDFVAENGLLSTVKGDSQDQTPSTVNAALRGLSEARRAQGVDRFAKAAAPQPRDVTFEFDPFNLSFGVPQGFTVKVYYLDPTLQGRLARGAPRTAGCFGTGRVCSGVETVVKVAVTDDLTGRRVEHWATVIDPTLSYAARIDRHACVSTTNAVTLTKGVVTKYDVTKPSEVAGCLSIPLDVLKAIIAAPVDAITGRTAKLQAEQALLTNRALVLQKELELRQAELAVAQARAAADD